MENFEITTDKNGRANQKAIDTVKQDNLTYNQGRTM